jgi:1,4-alpha-glucan branching enzyme
VTRKKDNGVRPEKRKRGSSPPPAPAGAGEILHGISRFSEHDVYLFKEGSHHKLYEKLGSCVMTVEGRPGTLFAVWAPNTRAVSVVGDFNGWSGSSHPLAVRWDGSGIWEGFLPDVGPGTLYKYQIDTGKRGRSVQKSDPMGFHWETSPKTASAVWELGYEWGDGDWMRDRAGKNALVAPQAVYEVHLGSWRRGESGRFLSYRELADSLVEYVTDLGFTHVEFLPVMEHPFYGSWGYQTVGYFAPTSRYGTPQDFMYLVDRLHQAGIGVILDWVPSHFPADEHSLARFDGTHLYEHADPRKGFHPDWKSAIFNYGRNEVRSFLISSAMFWLDRYHADGLRVDAVASMLYLDYSRKEGEWIPNEFGGRENLEAIHLLKRFNEAVYGVHPDVQTVAEESTAWPSVTRPVYAGGLGFGMKWNMGWMHDILDYMSKDSIHRKYHQDRLTFSLWYAFSENFLLPLSHDEVVHGKGSLLNRMSGDDWQKLANLRLLLGYQYLHPGKKLLFMGSEFGQWKEWDHESSLDWDLLQYDRHRGIRDWVSDLNRFYRSEPALYRKDFETGGFQWVDCSDYQNSIIAFLRKGDEEDARILAVCNFTPGPRHNYRIGVPASGVWMELLNSDAKDYGGSGQGNLGEVQAVPIRYHGHRHSLSLTLPPLGVVVFRPHRRAD